MDIYSLGIVFYWLLNNHRRPFLPVDRMPTIAEQNAASIKHYSGKYPLPKPMNGSAGLKQVALKVCSFNSKDRYTSADDMYRDLLAVESGV